jgi:hypothetical protein
MATYKVIQDIEADDKLVGPLSLKQFIFAVVAVGFGFVAFMIGSRTSWFAVIPFIPLIIVPAVLAAPLGRDQPTDVWLAAQLRFLLKPRKRIWDQTGIKDLVHITVPKKEEKQYTDGLSQTEVKSRLEALAKTLDSRGWAVQSAAIYGQTPAPAFVGGYDDGQRLIDPSSLPQTVEDSYVSSTEDMLDASNPVAQNFDSMVRQASQDQRAAIVAKMQTAAVGTPPPNPAPIATSSDDINTSFLKNSGAIETEEEKELAKKLKKQKETKQPTNPHHKVIKTPEQQAKEEKAQKAKEAKKQQAQAVTTPKNPDIVDLANTNDLSVESISHYANRNNKNNDGEVVINLR